MPKAYIPSRYRLLAYYCKVVADFVGGMEGLFYDIEFFAYFYESVDGAVELFAVVSG